MWYRAQYLIFWLTAIFCISVFTFVQNVWIKIFAIEVCSALFFVAVLTYFLPPAIQRLIHTNCLRWDGSWSNRREKIERNDVARMRGAMLGFTLLLLIPTNALLLLVDDQWFPFSIGVNAIEDFRLDTNEWKPRLQDEIRDFDRWSMDNRVPAENAELRKRLIWNSWPMIIILAAVWVIGNCCFVAKCYLIALGKLAESIRFRTESYKLHDLAAQE